MFTFDKRRKKISFKKIENTKKKHNHHKVLSASIKQFSSKPNKICDNNIETRKEY